MSFRAYLNGGGFVATESMSADYQPAEGEVLFADAPTSDELAVAFPSAVLDRAKTDRCAEVDDFRVARFEAGMSYGGKVLQLREQDQQRIIAAGAQAKFAVLTGSAWPEGFGWIMADNSVLALDAAGMSAMADAAAALVQAWIFNGHAHKASIRALGDAEAVAAYDISTGW